MMWNSFRFIKQQLAMLQPQSNEAVEFEYEEFYKLFVVFKIAVEKWSLTKKISC